MARKDAGDVGGNNFTRPARPLSAGKATPLSPLVRGVKAMRPRGGKGDAPDEGVEEKPP